MSSAALQQAGGADSLVFYPQSYQPVLNVNRRLIKCFCWFDFVLFKQKSLKKVSCFLPWEAAEQQWVGACLAVNTNRASQELSLPQAAFQRSLVPGMWSWPFPFHLTVGTHLNPHPEISRHFFAKSVVAKPHHLPALAMI